MLYPTRLGEVLGELFLSDAADLTIVVEHDSAGAGCALIKGKNVLFHNDKFLSC